MTASSWNGRTRSTIRRATRRLSLLNYRKEVTIEVLNLQGKPALAFKLSAPGSSEFQALPEMDANANAVAIRR